MFNLFLKIFVIVSFAFILVGCDPDEIQVEVYTSDVQLALEGKVVDIPVTFVFSMLGDDDEGTFDTVIEQIRGMVHPNTKFGKSESMLGESLIIESTIPMCKKEELKKASYPTPFYLQVEKQSNRNALVSFVDTNHREKISTTLRGLNFMLSLGEKAEETSIRVVSDTKDLVELNAVAVWVPAPMANMSESLKRRESKELIFKGGDSSIYSQINPNFVLTF